MLILCEYCKAEYVTQEPEHIHCCQDGGEAMREAFSKLPFVVRLHPGQELRVIGVE